MLTNLALFIVGAVLAAVGNGTAPCPPNLASSAHIHWSEHRDIQSPNCRWSIEIRPAKGEDGPAEAYVKGKAGSTQRLLFKLNRDGVIDWGKESDWLLLEDQQFSNHYRLKLFDLAKTDKSEPDALQIDEEIQANVEHKLKPGENINYYFPKFVTWLDGNLVVSVGVVTYEGKSGPFTLHCFGYEIGTPLLEIKSTLSEADLKKRYGTSCQIWP